MLRTLLLTSLIFTSTVYANPFGDAEKGKVKALIRREVSYVSHTCAAIGIGCNKAIMADA